MIVVDASALVAIAQRETDSDLYLAALERADIAYLSPANYVETGLILSQRRIVPNQARLALWLGELGIVLDESAELGVLALDAYLRFGKGFHPARLNLGDCFAYALARAFDAPLLYKGDDFALTDIRSALQPT